MKKLLVGLIILMISLTVNAQKKEIKDKFKDYTENNVY